MKLPKILLFLCFFSALPNAKAYLTYVNGRIDRALYDGHDPKTVIAGKIAQLHYRVIPNQSKYKPIEMLDGGPTYASLDFTVQNVIMGDYDLAGKQMNLVVSSFTWPEDLVKLDTNVFCILILREYKNQSPQFMIEVVIPSTGKTFSVEPGPRSKARDSALTKLFLENELLEVLKQKIPAVQLRGTLIQLGPILQKSNCSFIETFAADTNVWVKRAALACIVYASQNEEYVRLLADDVQEYFSKYNENGMIEGEKEYNGYAPFNLYYNYVFFLDPNDRNWGSRWDENEESLNKKTILKLKATGILTKSVCEKLAI